MEARGWTVCRFMIPSPLSYVRMPEPMSGLIWNGIVEARLCGSACVAVVAIHDLQHNSNGPSKEHHEQ